MDYHRLSDTELVALLQKGDSTAYSVIYERYHSLLFIYAHKKLQCTLEAQDVVHEVLIRLWDRRKRLALRRSLPSYLYAMVRNRAFDVFARKKLEDRYLVSLQQVLDAPTPADFRVREREVRDLIESEVRALPPRMREVFSLSRDQRLTNREIADRLSVSTHTVDTQIKRALKVLRLRLGLTSWLMYAVFYPF